MSTWKKVVVESGSNTIAQKSSGLASGTYGKITVDGSNDFTLATGAISAASQIGDNVITGGKLADATITNTQLGANAVTDSKISDSAITTSKILNNAVSLDKMAGLAKGKIIYGNDSGDPAALAIGSEGEVLKVNSSGQIEWGATSGITSLQADTSPQLGGTLELSDGTTPHDIKFGIVGSDTSKIVDPQDNELLTFGWDINAVNYPNLRNSPTGEAIEFKSLGSDTNIGIKLVPKGSGKVSISGFAFPTDHDSGTNSSKFLKGDGSWSTVSTITDMENLEDTTISGVTDHDVLYYDSGTSKWVNAAIAPKIKGETVEFLSTGSANHEKPLIVIGNHNYSSTSQTGSLHQPSNMMISTADITEYDVYKFATSTSENTVALGGNFTYTDDMEDASGDVPGLYLWNRDVKRTDYTSPTGAEQMDEIDDLLLRIRPAVTFGGHVGTGQYDRNDNQRVGIGTYIASDGDRADNIIFNSHGTSMWGSLTREFTAGDNAISKTDNTFWHVDNQVSTTMDTGQNTVWDWKGISSHANSEDVNQTGGPIKTFKQVGSYDSSHSGDSKGAFHTYNVMSSSANDSNGDHQATGTYGLNLVGYRGMIKGSNVKNYDSAAINGDWVGMSFGVRGKNGTQPTYDHQPNIDADVENIAALKATLDDSGEVEHGSLKIMMNSKGNLNTVDTFDTEVVKFQAQESDSATDMNYKPLLTIGEGSGYLRVGEIFCPGGSRTMEFKSGSYVEIHKADGLVSPKLTASGASGLVTTKVDASGDIQTDGYFQSTGSDTAQGIKNSDGDIVITWKNDTTVDIPGDSGMTDEVLFSVNGTALTVKNDGDVSVGKDLNVTGDITYGGDVTIVNSTDVSTTSSSYTLSSGANNAGDASGSNFAVETAVDNDPQLRWTNNHDYGTGWSIRPHNKETDYHMAGFLANSGAPGQNQEASGECVFYYDTTSKDLYICTSDVSNN